MNLFEQLRQMTIVVEDSGEIDFIRKHRPRDATTNPSLLHSAAMKPEYAHIVQRVLATSHNESMSRVLERLAVAFGVQILSLIEGRVSVEVDASLSFDSNATIQAARRIISLFAAHDVDKTRVLVKVAATWEGIFAAKQLEKEGIHCNLTLLFSFAQAVACAQANVTLISPFVGRIMDWYKKKRGVDFIEPVDDPGVQSVIRIYNYYKTYGYKTEVMGASFRNVGEIVELAGCDLLTISPGLIEQLKSTEGKLVRKLGSELIPSHVEGKIELDENYFRWMHNEDAMAIEKLAEGIRTFNADLQKLSAYLKSRTIG